MIEAYKIGIAIGLTNNVSRVLGVIRRDFATSEVAAARLEKAMTRIRLAGGVATASGAMAFGLYEGLSKALKPAEEYTHQLALMNNLGMKQKDIADSVTAAWKTARAVPTSTPTENLKSIMEMRQVFGGTEEAAKYLPAMEKLKAVVSSVTGKTGDEAFDVAKALELRGVSQNPAEFAKQASMIAQGVMASGGKVLPKDYLQLFRQAAPFTNRFNDEFAYRMLPTLMQDMGASRTGTALSTLGNALIGGRMTKASLGIWQKLGLVNSNAAVKEGSAGTVQIANPKEIKDSALFQANPLKYVQDVLLPAMQKAGANTPDQIQALISQMFSNRNAARIVSDFIVNSPRFAKDAALNGMPIGQDAAFNSLSRNDPNQAFHTLSAQWNTLMIALSRTVMPAVIDATLRLVKALEWLTDLANRHPRLTKFAVEMVALTTVVLGVTAAIGLLLIPFATVSTLFPAVGAGLAGVGAALSTIAAVALPILAATAAGGYAGYKTGQVWAQKDPSSFRSFHDKVDHALDFLGLGGLKAPIPTKQGGSGDVHTTVNLDGRTIADVVTKHQVKRMDSPSQGSGFFDGRRGYTPNTGN